MFVAPIWKTLDYLGNTPVRNLSVQEGPPHTRLQWFESLILKNLKQSKVTPSLKKTYAEIVLQKWLVHMRNIFPQHSTLELSHFRPWQVNSWQKESPSRFAKPWATSFGPLCVFLFSDWCFLGIFFALLDMQKLEMNSSLWRSAQGIRSHTSSEKFQKDN